MEEEGKKTATMFIERSNKSQVSSERRLERHSKLEDDESGGKVNQFMICKSTDPLFSKAPKWHRIPCGPSWGFGGKLVTYDDNAKPGEVSSAFRNISIRQVSSDVEFLSKSEKLENALVNENLLEYCKFKANEFYSNKNEAMSFAWTFLTSNFKENEFERRDEIVSVLGYNSSKTSSGDVDSDSPNLNYDSSPTKSSCTNDVDDNEDSCHSNEINPYLLEHKDNFTIETSDKNVGAIINRCILLGDAEKAVDKCIEENCWSEALLLSLFVCPGQASSTVRKFFTHSMTEKSWSSLLWCVVSRRLAVEASDKHHYTILSEMVLDVDLRFWREALAFLIRETTAEDCTRQRQLLDTLAKRLILQADEDGNKSWIVPALYCYVLSGNCDNVSRYCRNICGNLFNTVELVLIMQKAIRSKSIDTRADNLFAEYARCLASEGKLDAALRYMQNNSADNDLKNRLKAIILQQQQPPQPQRPRQASYDQYGSTVAAPNQQYTQRARSFSGFSQPVVRSPLQPPPLSNSGTNIFTYNAIPQQIPSYPKPLPPPPVTAWYQPVQAHLPHLPMQPLAPPPVAPMAQQFIPPSYTLQPAPPPQKQIPPPPMSNAVAWPISQQQPLPGVEQCDYQYSSGWNDPPVVNTTARRPSVSMSTFTPISTPIPGFIPEDAPQITRQVGRRSSISITTPNLVPVEVCPIYKDMYNTLDGLLVRLQQQVHNVHGVPLNIKRKIEDSRPKMDLLKSKLSSEGLLTSVTINGLRDLANCVSQNDYNGAMQIHNELVTTSTFGESSAFLPTIKGLLHIAQQILR